MKLLHLQKGSSRPVEIVGGANHPNGRGSRHKYLLRTCSLVCIPVALLFIQIPTMADGDTVVGVFDELPENNLIDNDSKLESQQTLPEPLPQSTSQKFLLASTKKLRRRSPETDFWSPANYPANLLEDDWKDVTRCDEKFLYFASDLEVLGTDFGGSGASKRGTSWKCPLSEKTAGSINGGE